MVGHQVLVLGIGVRAPVPEPCTTHFVRLRGLVRAQMLKEYLKNKN